MERFPAVVPERERLPETEDGCEAAMKDTSRSSGAATAAAPPPMGAAGPEPEAAKGMVGGEGRFRDILSRSVSPLFLNLEFRSLSLC